MPSGAEFTVLHYTGYDDDAGGIMSVVHALAGCGRFHCVLGVNPSCRQRRTPPLPVLELPRVAGEKIGWVNFWRARIVARAVQTWLRADATRVFHGHSRAGLLTGLWLHRFGERRVVVSVHCYGRQRWFYRWAARRLGTHLFWLSPAMRDYYDMPGDGWERCIPEAVPIPAASTRTAPGGMLRLGGAGTIVRWKGWHLVLEALARLPPELRRRVTFEHIGGTPAEDDARRYAAELVAETARLGFREQVFWRGAAPSSEKLLGGIDALVVVSRREPFSVAMLEALAAGVPVFAAESGGAVDVIRDGVNGRLHRTGDAAALAAQLVDALKQPPVWNAENIRGTTIPIARVAAQWAEVYSGL